MKARRIAAGFPVSGFVKNLEDGRVELLVEGSASDVANYLRAIQDAFGSMIQDVRQQSVEPGAEVLSGFVIRH